MSSGVTGLDCDPVGTKQPAGGARVVCSNTIVSTASPGTQQVRSTKQLGLQDGRADAPMQEKLHHLGNGIGDKFPTPAPIPRLTAIVGGCGKHRMTNGRAPRVAVPESHGHARSQHRRHFAGITQQQQFARLQETLRQAGSEEHVTHGRFPPCDKRPKRPCAPARQDRSRTPSARQRGIPRVAGCDRAGSPRPAGSACQNRS